MSIKIRGTDAHGSGYYGAPRHHLGRGYRHQGIDIVPHDDFGTVTAFEGGKVSKIGRPYHKNLGARSDFRYVEIRVPGGMRHRYFYVHPLVDVGVVVERGDIIGETQGLLEVFPGITDHYHFEVMLPGGWMEAKTDPVPILKELGYEFSEPL